VGDSAKWDIPRKRKVIVVLQRHVVTDILDQGNVGGMFDFVMLLLETARVT
jgi:hypothetical protein